MPELPGSREGREGSGPRRTSRSWQGHEMLLPCWQHQQGGRGGLPVTHPLPPLWHRHLQGTFPRGVVGDGLAGGTLTPCVALATQYGARTLHPALLLKGKRPAKTGVEGSPTSESKAPASDLGGSLSQTRGSNSAGQGVSGRSLMQPQFSPVTPTAAKQSAGELGPPSPPP